MATTICPKDAPPEVVNARRTESLDAPHIIKLVREPTDTLFGRVNVVNLIEKAVLAVTLCNDKDEILGHAAFFDFPNVKNVDEAEWESWMNAHYDCNRCSALNTLFMHYFVAKPEYAHGCAREIIRTAFNAVPDLHYLFLPVPVGVYPESALADIFKPLDKLEGSKGPDDCVVFACNRHDHVPVLHVRQARVEDHDDLTPIFNRQSDMLKMTYGDYFLAELIDAQDDHMHCLVAEVDGSAYGFMSISDDVNVELLNECFELGPFHGLRVQHPDDDTTPPQTPTPTPPPQKQEEPGEERPPSQASEKSAASAKGEVPEAEQGETIIQEPGEEEVQKEGSKPASLKSSRAGSTSEEPKIEKKLSDSHGAGALLNEQGDTAEDVKAALEHPEETESRKSSISKASQASGITTPKPLTPITKPPKRFVPTYNGDSNAFSIQLFCIDERFEMRSLDFLANAFGQFPDRDYCIVTVPHMVPEFPLLQGFVRITPRCPSTLAQELYVFNRAGLLKDIRVRKACTSDYENVQKLVSTVDLNENLLKDLQQYNKARRDMDGTELQAFVAETQGQIVGVAIVRREEDIEYIRSHYNIEDFIYYNHHKRTDHGHLHHLALNPIFSHLSKHFLKEILRLGHKTCLYYPLYPAYTQKEIVETHSLVCVLNDLVPVRSRRQIIYPMEQLGHNAPSERVLKKQEPYALNHINRKLTLEPKVTVNARIVVVGASDVGIAFLETLAYCPHLRYNNLTLISPHGLPGDMNLEDQKDLVMSSSHCYSQEQYAKSSLRTWINIVYGKVTSIDRKKKRVTVNGNSFVPFDHLVLATGEQYQVPAPTYADVDGGAMNSDLPYSPDCRYEGTPPKNMFVINDSYDAAVALYWVENGLVESQKHIVVYGNTIDAYCCVQALLSMDIAGSRIHLVEPPLAYQTTCFNNSVVEETVKKALAESGVKTHSNCILAQWNDGTEGTEITCVSFTTNSEPLRLECGAFFAYYEKAVDDDTYKAVNDACLVYDGKLVIDAAFHTNDVSIRGAGTLTKFQRKYHADQWTHANFNSKEIGIHLATEMLRLFDPTLEPQYSPSEEQLNLIPMYRNPKIYGGVLPGGYHYLQVSKPGLPTPLDVQMAQADFGRELVTGTPGGQPDYFRVHMNQYNTVETITCLSKQEIPFENLVCLYGIHERCLNSMVSRFDEGLVQDFYSYFMETWCLSIYHDRFADFRDEVRELLITSQGEGIESMEDKVRNVVDEDVPMNEVQRKILMDEYVKSGARRTVETRLLNFMSYNYYHLPMYAKPGMV